MEKIENNAKEPEILEIQKDGVSVSDISENKEEIKQEENKPEVIQQKQSAPTPIQEFSDNLREHISL